ncbi:hypothetical protein [Bifidobacterium sp. SO1]|uniref:hypothetical protein n=1 Tax=Bifidobacterium sp. SO1 TaxID=2809029 RepID=UPI001BDCAD30|nr:hypothetical protein [Bifidobacterium sp. SO1]MBT1162955.1 hypothetical protein [Bifidobacterium sp. SO1]
MTDVSNRSRKPKGMSEGGQFDLEHDNTHGDDDITPMFDPFAGLHAETIGTDDPLTFDEFDLCADIGFPLDEAADWDGRIVFAQNIETDDALILPRILRIYDERIRFEDPADPTIGEDLDPQDIQNGIVHLRHPYDDAGNSRISRQSLSEDAIGELASIGTTPNPDPKLADTDNLIVAATLAGNPNANEAMLDTLIDHDESGIATSMIAERPDLSEAIQNRLAALKAKPQWDMDRLPWQQQDLAPSAQLTLLRNDPDAAGTMTHTQIHPVPEVYEYGLARTLAEAGSRVDWLAEERYPVERLRSQPFLRNADIPADIRERMSRLAWIALASRGTESERRKLTHSTDREIAKTALLSFR